MPNRVALGVTITLDHILIHSVAIFWGYRKVNTLKGNLFRCMASITSIIFRVTEMNKHISGTTSYFQKAFRLSNHSVNDMLTEATDRKRQRERKEIDHVMQLWLVCDGDKAAGVHWGAEREFSLCQRRQFVPSPSAHHITEAEACHGPPLRCLVDLFSHTGDVLLQQCACVGGCTWNAIIHYYLAMKPLLEATKNKSR